MNQENKEARFKLWWWDVGSGIRPEPGDDHEQHAERVARIAWNDAFVVAETNQEKNSND